jgi:hypothetical protein
MGLRAGLGQTRKSLTIALWAARPPSPTGTLFDHLTFVVGLLQNGETVESVVTISLPTLTKAQVYECLAYYEDHRGAIDLLVAQQMARDQR